MSEFEFSNNIDRKFPWSFLGFFSGLIFGIFGIYAVFIYERLPEIRVEVLSNTPVFSIKEEVDNLSILFNGVDIRESKQLLSILTIKILNSGNLSITTGDFDENDPLSIVVDSGNVIKADMLNTADSYFKKVFLQSNKIEKGIELPKFILEPGQYFIFKILVLHDASKQPAVKSKGRVAKIGSVDVISTLESPNLGLIPLSFYGDFSIQAVRVGGYGIGTIAVLLLIALSFAYSKEKYEQIKRKKRQKDLQNKGNSFLKTVNPRLAEKLKPFVQLMSSDPKYSRHVISRLFEVTERFNHTENKMHRDQMVHYINRFLEDMPPWVVEGGEIKIDDLDDEFIVELRRLFKFLRD